MSVEKLWFERGFEVGENIENVWWGTVPKALDPMAVKQVGGVISWMAEEDLRVRVCVCV